MSEADDGEFLELANFFLGEVIAPFLSFPVFWQMCRELGWLPTSATDSTNSSLEGLFRSASDLEQRLRAILRELEASEQPSADEFLGFLSAAVDFIDRISSPANDIPGIVASEGFWVSIADSVLSTAVARTLRYKLPIVFAVVRLVGVLTYERHVAMSQRAAYATWQLRPENVKFLLDPPALAREVYGWGEAEFRWELLLDSIGDCLDVFGFDGFQGQLLYGWETGFFGESYGAPDMLSLNVPLLTPLDGGQLSLFLMPVPSPSQRNGRRTGIVLGLVASGQLPTTSDQPIRVRGGVSASIAAGIELQPNGVTAFVEGGVGTDSIELVMDLPRLFGSSDQFRIAVPGAGLTLVITRPEVALSIGWGGQARGGVRLSVEELLLDFSGLSRGGFLGSLLGGETPRLSSRFALVWSSDGGFSFEGSASLRIQLHISVVIGILEFHSLSLSLRANEDGLELLAESAVVGRLGPVQVSLDGLGAAAYLGSTQHSFSFSLGSGVFAGLALAGPTGISVAIDAACLTGAGSLLVEPGGRYIGGLALAIGDLVLAAFGIVQDGLADESQWSFLIVIAAEFPAVQLGLGFVLKGVGGLCGVHRTVLVPTLQSEMRAGRLGGALFPTRPFQDVSQLIRGISGVFPAAQDRYVFGPIFKLGWGTPVVVLIDLMVLISLPAPVVIALVGQIGATFPDAGNSIVKLHVDLVGVVDFGEGTLSIDASLRDSRIAAFALSGDLAVRLRWGDNPDFAFSMGGFHKAFTPPANFPELRRLTLALGSGNNPRLSLAAYLALTSNSLQFGARAELYAEAAGFNVFGYVEFHALIIFKPFSFRFDIAAMVALRRGTTVLMGISVAGMISGPTPWHVQGSASITILFFEVSVDFDTTFGDPALPEEADLVDLWEQLRPAVRELGNWNAELPIGGQRVVSYAELEGETPLTRFDPRGAMVLREKVLPLGRRVTKFGEKTVAAPTTLSIASVRVGERAVPTPPAVQEHFAPGQFQTLTDAEKLSRPSFEKMDAGIRLASEAVEARAPTATRLEFETVEVGEESSSVRALAAYTPTAALLAFAGGSTPRATAGMERVGNDRFLPPSGTAPLVRLDAEKVCIVRAKTLTPSTILPPTDAPGAAYDALAAFERAHPEARSTYRVVPAHEEVADHAPAA